MVVRLDERGWLLLFAAAGLALSLGVLWARKRSAAAAAPLVGAEPAPASFGAGIGELDRVADARIVTPAADRTSVGETPDKDPPTKTERDLDPSRIAALVADLADDGIRGNALRAMTLLDRAGPTAQEALVDAIRSPDRQQRHLAAQLLRHGRRPPDQNLLQVTLEGLRADALPKGATSNCDTAALATSCFEYLDQHFAAANGGLRRTLYSDCPLARFLSALLLARHGDRGVLADVCDVLVPHLADNRIRNDAMLATAALYRLGPQVVPHLLAARRRDPQTVRLLELLELDIRQPTEDYAELLRRRHRYRLRDLTNMTVEPALRPGNWSLTPVVRAFRQAVQ